MALEMTVSNLVAAPQATQVLKALTLLCLNEHVNLRNFTQHSALPA
jgi:hypothetical protein